MGKTVNDFPDPSDRRMSVSIVGAITPKCHRADIN